MEGPDDLCSIGAASVAAIITLRRFVPSSFFVFRRLSVPRVFLHCLVASLHALLSAVRFTEVDAGREMRR